MTEHAHLPHFEIGHEVIDSHHREIFHLVSSLDDVVHSNRRERINDIIVFLEQYMLEHFGEEEAVMQAAHYDEYEYHHREHEIFRLRIQELRKFFDNNTPNTHLIFNIRRFVDRLVDHILTVDSGIARITHTHDQKIS